MTTLGGYFRQLAAEGTDRQLSFYTEHGGKKLLRNIRLLLVQRSEHLLTMWIMKDANTTTHPQPPSGGGGRGRG
jgi:hypothetical protein